MPKQLSLIDCSIWYHQSHGNKKPEAGWATFSDGMHVSWNHGVPDRDTMYLYIQVQYGERSYTNPSIKRRINEPKRVL